jgi:1-deoxy-D-xylulose-5-phosphate reductoisomerase
MKTDTIKRKIAVLGSTGSIGTQALDVVRSNPDRFEIYALTANHQVDLLIAQAREFLPEVAVIADESLYGKLQAALSDLPIKVWAGSDAIAQVVELQDIDLVLTALVGYSGLKPTIHAIKAGKAIALANKETLVVAGELITALALQYKVPILPVDSEHSAIFQCLNGEHCAIEKILLTASGGPFRRKSHDELLQVTKNDALKHPNWNMGAKVTIDSASMMNKGFEMIEARWLFGVSPEQIQVVVHPQSIVHSMVQFEDSSVIAQMGVPDMHLPIQYALTFPERLKTSFDRVDFFKLGTLSFEEPDLEKFKNLAYAYEAIASGGNMPCVLNAANEVAVAAFLQDRVGFLEMSDMIEQTIGKATFVAKPTYQDYVESDAQARRIAAELIRK